MAHRMGPLMPSGAFFSRSKKNKKRTKRRKGSSKRRGGCGKTITIRVVGARVAGSRYGRKRRSSGRKRRSYGKSTYKRRKASTVVSKTGRVYKKGGRKGYRRVGSCRRRGRRWV